MLITLEIGVQLLVDIEGAGLVPDGAAMRSKPAGRLINSCAHRSTTPSRRPRRLAWPA